ncbi:MAG: DUF3298 domain-containing protein [Candidatus Andersenbacteria bacterium]
MPATRNRHTKLCLPLALSVASVGVLIAGVALVVAISRQPSTHPTAFTVAEARIQRSNDAPMFSVDVRYPKISGGSATAATQINALLQVDINALVDNFVVDARQAEPSTTLGSDLSTTYVATTVGGVLSIALTVDEFQQGAAHPNSTTLAYSFRVADGSLLALSDVFKPGSAYLARLSEQAIARLSSNTDLPDVATGAAPTAEIFQRWLLDNDGLTVFFDPYQVGPYAAGPQRVTIPYGTLDDLLSPEARTLLGR